VNRAGGKLQKVSVVKKDDNKRSEKNACWHIAGKREHRNWDINMLLRS